MNKEQNNNQLPKDWKWVTIPEVVSKNGVFADGDWIESKDQDPKGDVRLIQLADIGDGYFRNKSSRYLTLKRAKEINCTFLLDGDILVARMPDPIGRSCIFPLKGKNKFVTAVDVAIIRPDAEIIDKKYLLYSINNPKYRNSIENLQSGTTRKRISRKNLSILAFPLPPKTTQQAIVSKIEELFSEIDKGIENLRLAQHQLKTYRQSVLKWAFEGKLTNETVKEGELPKGWKNVALGSVCSLITDGKHGDCDNEENSGFYFLSAKDVRNNTLLWENARQISKAGFEETHRRTNLKPGDICLVNTGATIGRISIAPNDEKTYKSTFQKSVAVIKCIPDLIENKYCKYLLQGDLKKLVKVSSGTAVPNLLLGTLKVHLINLPPSLEEQNKIVQEIEGRLSVADNLEESITQSLQHAEALRQSILKKAFEGRL